MTPEEFVKKHEFPENGEEINKKLVRDIQDPDKKHLKQMNLEKLLKNNARLIPMIKNQFSYDQELASVMSYVYQGLKKATTTFDPTMGTKFYIYAVQTIRGIMQNDYNYTHDLIHIPVMKKAKLDKKINTEVGIRHEYYDINEHQEYHPYEDIESDEEGALSNELSMILTEYENGKDLPVDVIEDLKIFKMAREHTLKDISEKTGISTVRIRTILDRMTLRIKKFYATFKKEYYK